MIYLDNASTTWPKPEAVLREMQRFLAEDAANPGRGTHRMARRCSRLIEDLRRKLARLIGAPDSQRMVLCCNCTDALNMAVKGALAEGDHVILTGLEHNSLNRPLQVLADAGHIELTRLPADGHGFVDPDDFRRAWKPNTRLAACTHASNVLGTIQPVAQIGRIIRERDGLFLVDAAQTIGLVPVALEDLRVDLLAFSGHKELLGPPGTGGLYVGARAELRSWRQGGTGLDSDSPTQPTNFPEFLEAGTPNTVGLAGLATAIDYLNSFAEGQLLARARGLIRLLLEELACDCRFIVHGPGHTERSVGVLSLSVSGLGAEEVGAVLDQSFDIAVRPGLHCAPYTHRALGTAPGGTVRISVGPFNTPEEIRRVVDALRQVADSA